MDESRYFSQPILLMPKKRLAETKIRKQTEKNTDTNIWIK
jgi:hypothetical protein